VTKQKCRRTRGAARGKRRRDATDWGVVHLWRKKSALQSFTPRPVKQRPFNYAGANLFGGFRGGYFFEGGSLCLVSRLAEVPGKTTTTTTISLPPWAAVISVSTNGGLHIRLTRRGQATWGERTIRSGIRCKGDRHMRGQQGGDRGKVGKAREGKGRQRKGREARNRRWVQSVDSALAQRAGAGLRGAPSHFIEFTSHRPFTRAHL